MRAINVLHGALFRRKFEISLRVEFNKKFRYVETSVLTARRFQNIEDNKAVFTDFSEDMTEPDIANVVGFFNTNHKDGQITSHLHLPTCQCGGSVVSAAKYGWQFLSSSKFRTFDTPILYRWKHFGLVSSFILRGVSVHNCLPDTVVRTLASMKVPLNPGNVARSHESDRQ